MTSRESVEGLLRAGGLRFGEPQHAGALTVIPVFHGGEAVTYRMLSEEEDRVRVEEVDGGSVPHLLVHNGSDEAVLLVEGEVIGGLRQTRTLNVTVLVPARTSLTVPVACVEAGRWGQARPFVREGSYLAPRVRHPKNLGLRTAGPGSLATDQGRVWAAVSDHLLRHDVQSPTESYMDGAHRRAAESRALVAGLAPVPGQQGVLALVGGQAAVLDLFDQSRTLRHLWEPLVASYALDALVATGTAGPAEIASAREKVAGLAAGSAETRPAVGRGEVVFIRAAEAMVSALVVGRAVVHLAAIWTPAPAPHRPRMARPSSRRSWFESRP